jgi:hypothetical protein
MKNLIVLLFTICLSVCSVNVYAQGTISALASEEADLTTSHPSCGSFDLMHHMDHQAPEFLELSNEFMANLSHVITAQQQDRAFADLYVIPIVFHIVYNTEEENLPDSVIFNQLEILNNCFRRKNADTSETRAQFLDLVGDSKIEFKLAEFDPAGEPTIGITRTYTPIEYFGGVLPHGPGETEEIQDWVDDSLYYNFFRITETALGGQDPWDTDHYLNVWSGDMRVFEPEFGDFEEVVLFGMATPPIDHVNWPADILGPLSGYDKGVLIHFMNFGGNNPVPLPAPYAAYNGVVTTGEILVHEVGHYLGLRHIWGDGDCTFHDYIDDTPNSNASGTWNCNTALNTCTDDIGGVNLPNMVENYMDYTSGECQNSFTIGQADLMRTVLEEYRPGLSEVISTASINASASKNSILLYPNPSNGNFSINLEEEGENVQVYIQNSVGQLIYFEEISYAKQVSFNLDIAPGVYFLRINNNGEEATTVKFIVE